MYKNCAFTGHRKLERDFDYNLLDKVIFNLLVGGTENFYCGMAYGFDLAAAESLLQYKEQFKFNLIACVPCPEQHSTFSQKNKEKYFKILEKCDEVKILSDEYYDGCMFARDRYLVDNCDVLVAYKRHERGGASYTVNYANKKSVNVIEL